QVLRAWRESGVTHTIVVTLPADEALRADCRLPGVTVLAADPPPADMKASVWHALDYVGRTFSPQPADAWLLAPADMPLLSPVAAAALLTAHQPLQPAILQPVLADCRVGHPVLFPWPLAAHVSALPPDAGVNELIRQHGSTKVPCPTVPAAGDIDTPQDYSRLHDRHGRHDRHSP
ncbi:MAG: NTP transferase domain-containing protein, partial [Pirellulales bacterium]